MSLASELLMSAGVLLTFALLWIAVSWRIRLFRQALFFRHLAVMLRLGSPLSDALSSADEGIRALPPHLLLPLRDEVGDGKKFSEALTRHARPFEARQILLISAGEKSGTLPEVCARLGRYPASIATLGTHVLVMLAYLTLLASVAGLGWTGYAIFILPQFTKAIGDTGLAHAGPLRLFDLSLDVTLAVLTIPWLLLLAFHLGRGLQLRAITSRAVLLLPGLRGHAWDAACLTLARGLGVLHSARLSSREVAAFLPTLSTNTAIGDRLRRASAHVVSGRSLSAALHEEGFPDPMVQFIEWGEASGAPEEMLRAAERHFEARIERRVFLVHRVLFPAMIAAIGVAVALLGLTVFASLRELTLGMVE